jgi:hypothetical protein
MAAETFRANLIIRYGKLRNLWNRHVGEGVASSLANHSRAPLKASAGQMGVLQSGTFPMSHQSKIIRLATGLLALTATAFTNPEQNQMMEALKWREELSAEVKNGETKPDDAVERLRSKRGASGLPIPADDADFAVAAIDIGHRLLLRHPAEAEVFFRAAEAALDQEVKRTDDAQAKEKALYLQKLALIRSNYLNKSEQAQADMAAAVQLQPEDKYLGQFQKYLATRTSKPERALAPKEGSK